MNNTYETELKLLQKLIDDFGISDYAIVNKNTGEYQDIVNGSKLILPNAKKKDKNNRELVKFIPKECFLKMYRKTVRELGNELTNRDFTCFTRMSTYTRMNDCVLCDDDGNQLNIKQLSNLLKIDYSNLKKLIKVFEEKELLIKSGQAIIINPYLFMNGEYIVKDIRDKFSKTKWATLA